VFDTASGLSALTLERETWTCHSFYVYVLACTHILRKDMERDCNEAHAREDGERGVDIGMFYSCDGMPYLVF
jgi:hypothetical protein